MSKILALVEIDDTSWDIPSTSYGVAVMELKRNNDTELVWMAIASFYGKDLYEIALPEEYQKLSIIGRIVNRRRRFYDIDPIKYEEFPL